MRVGARNSKPKGMSRARARDNRESNELKSLNSNEQKSERDPNPQAKWFVLVIFPNRPLFIVFPSIFGRIGR